MFKLFFGRSFLTSLLLSVGVLVVLGATASHAKVEKPKQIVFRPSSHCIAPQWSPDGKKIAIDVYKPSSESREVWVFDLSPTLSIERKEQVLPLGVRASRLAGNKLPPVVEFSWTPDMEMLSPPYVFSSQGLNRKNFDIYADGNWITQANTGNDGQPVISPDSNYLAYTSQQKESGDIMMIDFTGDIEKPIRLTSTPYATEYLPQWHPTQPRLLFIRSQKSRGQDIVIMNDPKNPGRTKDLTNWSADEIRPHWSPDGKKIAFYSNQDSPNDQVFNLWVINADGTQAKLLAKDVIVDDHKGAAWSADSSNIFFVKRDLSRANPIMWINLKSKKSGIITQETQLNSDLSAHYTRDGATMLAYTAKGFKRSKDKSWRRIFVVKFTMSDLK
jgi:Tol biopolymer transport system component